MVQMTVLEQQSSHDSAAADRTEKSLKLLFNSLKEVLSTERDYVSFLSIIEEKFKKPIEGAFMIQKEDVEIVFGNIKEIQSYHEKVLLPNIEILLGGLEADKEYHQSAIKGLCKVFDDFTERSCLYERYAMNFKAALERITNLIHSNVVLRNFLEGVFEEMNGSLKLTIHAYLIMPVQRLPRYRLLFESISKNCNFLNDKDTFRDVLDGTITKINRVTHLVNEKIRESEMLMLLVETQKCLLGYRKNIVAPGRSLLKTGLLSKVCRKNDKQLQFFLFSDILIYCKVFNLIEKRYLFKREIPLSSISVVLNNNEHCFGIVSNEKSFVVRCQLISEKDSWVESIRVAVAKTGHNNDTRQERNVFAPIWIPDRECSNCMICKSPFTLFNRRHHCRVCGWILCNSCSSKTAIINGRKGQQRICNNCWEFENHRIPANGRSEQTLKHSQSEFINCARCSAMFNSFSRKLNCKSCDKVFCVSCIKMDDNPISCICLDCDINVKE